MSPILHRNALEIISRSAEQTRRVGMRLGALLQPGDVICLIGDLGSGKTTFVQGVAAGWGSLDPVSSPTFVIVNLYRRLDNSQLFHLDAYRLSGPAEAMTSTWTPCSMTALSSSNGLTSSPMPCPRSGFGLRCTM